MATFGNIGSSADYESIIIYDKGAALYVLPETGSITNITAYINYPAGGIGSLRVRGGIYSDSTGSPDVLKCYQSGYISIPSGTPASWKDFTPDTGSLVLPAGSYWLTLQNSGWGGTLQISYSGTGNWCEADDTWDDGLEDPFGDTKSDDTEAKSIYATYTVAPSIKTKTLTSDANISSAVATKTLTSDSRIKTINSKTLTSDGRIKTISSNTLTSDARTKLISTKLLVSDTNIRTISIPTLIYPTDSLDVSPPIAFMWEIPSHVGDKDIHSQIQVAEESNFTTLIFDKRSLFDAGSFEYISGGTWIPYPAGGVGSTFYGGSARISLSPGTGSTFYWRVRGGVDD